MPILKKNQIRVLAFLLLFLIPFTIYFATLKNYEFLMYIGVIFFFMAVIILTNKRVDYPLPVLWGLAAWALLHMSGGGFFINGTRLYEIMLIPLSETYPVLRYDQFVHIIGFGVATMLMFYLLRPLLPIRIKKWAALSIVIIMAGLGVGALNEIIEFTATVLAPETGVGGYENTSLDMVADLVGAVLAMGFLYWKEKNGKIPYKRH